MHACVLVIFSILLVWFCALCTRTAVQKISPTKPCHTVKDVRYVRLSRRKGPLEIAEVQIYDEHGMNLAPLYGTPRQSSTFQKDTMKYGPQIAVNGNTSGIPDRGETARTGAHDRSPWWEFTLPRNVAVSQVAVYLSSHDHFPNPESDFEPNNNLRIQLQLLCPERMPVWETTLTYWQPRFDYKIQ